MVPQWESVDPLVVKKIIKVLNQNVRKFVLERRPSFLMLAGVRSLEVSQGRILVGVSFSRVPSIQFIVLVPEGANLKHRMV